MGEVRGSFPSNEGLEFGNSGRQLSKVTIAKMGVIFKMDVLELDMKILRSKNSMKKAQIKIDFARDNDFKKTLLPESDF